MITEDYCSFELSKLLKEKGFDGECMGCYWDSKQIFDINYEPLSYSDGDLRDEVILAPTHQMAMKWLRCKGIYIEIYVLGKTDIKYGFTILKLNEGKLYSDDKTYTTFEEAVEAALKYCLTKVI